MNCIYNLISKFLTLSLRAEIFLCHTHTHIKFYNEMKPIRSTTYSLHVCVCVNVHQNVLDVSMAFGSTNIKIANVLWKYSITHTHTHSVNTNVTSFFLSVSVLLLWLLLLIVFDTKMQRTLKEVKLFVFSWDNMVPKFSIWSHVTKGCAN